MCQPNLVTFKCKIIRPKNRVRYVWLGQNTSISFPPVPWDVAPVIGHSKEEYGTSEDDDSLKRTVQKVDL